MFTGKKFTKSLLTPVYGWLTRFVRTAGCSYAGKSHIFTEMSANTMKNQHTLKTGAQVKGREVQGYKVAKPDELKFLNQSGVLFKHTEEPMMTEMQRCPTNYISSTVKIRRVSEEIGYSLFTNSHFKPTDSLFEVIIPFADLRRYKDMHSIQVSKDWHWCTMKSPIQYIQHSCFDINVKYVFEEFDESKKIGTNGINAVSNLYGFTNSEKGNFGVFKVIALQHLTPDTLATVNYNSFEWEMSCCFTDAKAPSEYDSLTNGITPTKTDVPDMNGLQDGTGEKGRKVMGYKFAKPDEKKFLQERDLLFKHIKDLIVEEGNINL